MAPGRPRQRIRRPRGREYAIPWWRPWRLLAPSQPMSRPARRLRAVVLLGTFALAVTLLTTRDGTDAPDGGDPDGGQAASTGPDDDAATAGDAADDGGADDAGAAAQPIDPATVAAVAPAVPVDVPAPLPAPGPEGAPIVTRIETTDPVVFVTIDDGFTRSPEAARVIDELNIPVTLFLLDEPVLDDPAYFAALPHAVIEGHGRAHADLRGLAEEAQRADVCGNADTVGATFGRRPLLFRPPYGTHDDATRRAAAACGMAAIVLWEASVESGDLRFRTVPRLRAGDIVLLHFRPELAGELRMLAHQVESAGLRFAALEDYLVPSGAPVLGPTGGVPRGS